MLYKLCDEGIDSARFYDCEYGNISVNINPMGFGNILKELYNIRIAIRWMTNIYKLNCKNKEFRIKHELQHVQYRLKVN